MSANENLHAATAAAEETARVAVAAAEKAKADLKAARDAEKLAEKEEAARILAEKVTEKRDEYDGSFGSNGEWLGAEIGHDGDLDLSVLEYTEYHGSVTITREQAIALRDFLNENYKG